MPYLGARSMLVLRQPSGEVDGVRRKYPVFLQVLPVYSHTVHLGLAVRRPHGARATHARRTRLAPRVGSVKVS